MSRFLLDLLNGPTGADLAARSGAIGATWAKQNGGSADLILSPVNRAMGNANALARYVASGIPDSPDYDAVALLRKLSAHGEGGVMARASTTEDTGYVLSHVQSTGDWHLRRFNAGVATALGTVTQTWPLDTDKGVRLRLRTVNGGATVRLVARIDGVEVLTANDSAAGRILTAGRVGLRLHPGTTSLFAVRGYHVNLVTAVALPDDPRPRASKPADGPLAQRIAAKAAAEQAAEHAAIHLENGAPPAWQVLVGATTYTLSLPQGLTATVGLLEIPEVACDPAPPVPLSLPLRFVRPPVLVRDGTIREADDDQGDPFFAVNRGENATAALREAIARAVFGQGTV